MREPTAQQKARDSIVKNVIRGVLDSEDRLKKVDAWRAAQEIQRLISLRQFAVLSISG
jgi:hypothetical protein